MRAYLVEDLPPELCRRLADFAQGYARHFGSPRGVTLTYHPVYVIAGRTRALHVSGENTIFASV